MSLPCRMENASKIVSRLFDQYFKPENARWKHAFLKYLDDIELVERRIETLQACSTGSLAQNFSISKDIRRSILLGIKEPWSKVTQYVYSGDEPEVIASQARDVAEDIVYNIRLICSQDMPAELKSFVDDLEQTVLLDTDDFPNRNTKINHHGKDHLGMLPLDW